MDTSVIICTHNRAKYLGGTIEAAAAQILPQGEFEILVVDNYSWGEPFVDQWLRRFEVKPTAWPPLRMFVKSPA